MSTFSIVIIWMVLAAGLILPIRSIPYNPCPPRFYRTRYQVVIHNDGHTSLVCRIRICPVLSSKKRSTETVMDMIDMAEKEKEIREENLSVDGFFRAVDTDCDGYLDSCEWNKLDSGVKEFVDVLGRVNSTDELLSLEEFKQFDYTLEVRIDMVMPMDDLKMMMEDMAGQDEDNDGEEDDGPKDRKRPDGDNP